MENITLAAKFLEIVNEHGFSVSNVQRKGNGYVVVFSLPVGKDNNWEVAISFDGTSAGLVKAMRTKLDSFPSRAIKYEKFIDLYWDLWEVFGDDTDTGTPVEMLTADNIFANLF